MGKAKEKKPKAAIDRPVEAIIHGEARRKNIPTAEFQSIMDKKDQSPIQIAYERRNRDLDPQLVWRGKDTQDWSDLLVSAPPLFIQEKVHPKVLIDDLKRHSQEKSTAPKRASEQLDLFADFNGLPSSDAKTEFYQHDSNWSNRMILGDSLQVMASLAEREGLRGKVQCIYIDPPYGIKFNSNFQWSTTSRDVKDGNAHHITREPEQVKAFRDTWRDGIHSYLTYLRDRLTVARDLLTESGSVFVQIGDENVHRVRAVMDEVFGEGNFCALIPFQKTSGQESKIIATTLDYLVWYAKKSDLLKFRQLFQDREVGAKSLDRYDMLLLADGSTKRLNSNEIKTGEIPNDASRYQLSALYSDGASQGDQKFKFEGKTYEPRPGTHWKTTIDGLKKLNIADRAERMGNVLRYRRFANDFPVLPLTDRWDSVQLGTEKHYVVETSAKVLERCLLMTTDPGDLVLDPTCGSGTTAYVAEQWGRRWITIDTSRVALALARARLMGARYPYYLLADSHEGVIKEAQLSSRSARSQSPTYGDIRHGFVYERVPHITLKSIANNTEIDVIWDRYQELLEPLRAALNKALGKSWEEWEIPRDADKSWDASAKEIHKNWWKERVARQRAIDASISAKAEYEYLYDKPYADNKKIRVSGPFTVESLSPHRVLDLDENDELIDPSKSPLRTDEGTDFAHVILETLKVAGVQQANKEDKINFIALTPWPGQEYICAEGRFREKEGAPEKRAGIFIGPEFGTVSRVDLVGAAQEAGEAGFDVVIACAFSYDAHASDVGKIGRIPILKARMNADLHMSGELKNTGKGNLFVIFGEPDIDILEADNAQVQIKINGVDVFDPSTGEVRSDSTDGIACWFIDTEYNKESFFVRHAYFLGANDPYKSLKTTLKADINQEAWSSLNSDTSRPFDKPTSGRIAVKVINHLGDEVMKVFRV